MGDEENDDIEREETRGCGSGGFSIFLDEGEMVSFMEDGDFSSARDLDLFRNIEEAIEKKLKSGGSSLLALSAGEKRISRDFSVLQIAHLLARRGRKVLIVDLDFLEPGLSGLVENIEEHGFLDLLLYGSSLKSVLRPTGIDGVSVTGPGSFPVSRTIPFALKEFGKVNEFLSRNGDVVIYCSTLYTEDGGVNPLPPLVDGILLCCRIEEMKEGELQEKLKDLGSDLPPADLLCFCKGREREFAPAGIPAPVDFEDEEGEDILELDPESAIPDAEGDGEAAGSVYIERSDELDTMKKASRKRINLPTIIGAALIAMIAVFLIWWQMMDRSIKSKEETGKMTELVKKQQEARDMGAGPDSSSGIAAANAADTAAGETGGGSPVDTAGEGAPPDTAAGSAATGITDAHQPAAAIGGEGAAGEKAVSDEASTARRDAAPAQEGIYYSVHVASFKEMSRAETEMEHLGKEGYETHLLEAEIKGEKWLRVYVGKFGDRETAERTRVELLGIKRIGYAKVVKLKY